MSFFKDFKSDISQAMNELMPDGNEVLEDNKAKPKKKKGTNPLSKNLNKDPGLDNKELADVNLPDLDDIAPEDMLDQIDDLLNNELYNDGKNADLLLDDDMEVNTMDMSVDDLLNQLSAKQSKSVNKTKGTTKDETSSVAADGSGGKDDEAGSETDDVDELLSSLAEGDFDGASVEEQEATPERDEIVNDDLNASLLDDLLADENSDKASTEASADETKSDEIPVDDSSSEDVAVEDLVKETEPEEDTLEDTGYEDVPVKDSVEETASEETSSEDTTYEETQIEDNTSEEVPVDDSVEETAVEENLSEGTEYEEAQVEDIKTEDVPVEYPVEETASEETLSEDAVSEDTVSEENVAYDAASDKNLTEEIPAKDLPADDDSTKESKVAINDTKASENRKENSFVEEKDVISINTVEDNKDNASNDKPKTKEDKAKVSSEKKFNVNDADTETTYITKGTKIKGDLETDGSIDIIGSVEGSVTCQGKVVVGGSVKGNITAGELYANGAHIEGDVKSYGSVKVGVGSMIIGGIEGESAVIAGAVNGDIDVKGPVIVDSTAVIMGNIKSRSVQINNGAVIEGFCSQSYSDIDVKSFFA